jgi:hypothetical protein
MWQEIIVGICIVVAAVSVGLRFWKKFSAYKTTDQKCGCECSDCSMNPQASCKKAE